MKIHVCFITYKDSIAFAAVTSFVLVKRDRGLSYYFHQPQHSQQEDCFLCPFITRGLFLCPFILNFKG